MELAGIDIKRFCDEERRQARLPDPEFHSVSARTKSERLSRDGQKVDLNVSQVRKAGSPPLLVRESSANRSNLHFRRVFFNSL